MQEPAAASQMLALGRLGWGAKRIARAGGSVHCVKARTTASLSMNATGFSETHLPTAWSELTNQDISAYIVGYIHQAAIGAPLLP